MRSRVTTNPKAAIAPKLVEFERYLENTLDVPETVEA